MTGKQSA